ncbi:hypothetical protein BJY52DRAFT_1248454 [Lactarius psammicola]|nr:hypothetical protein BJY52DRAFT_1248454 [Lactarius psammicola]
MFPRSFPLFCLTFHVQAAVYLPRALRLLLKNTYPHRTVSFNELSSHPFPSTPLLRLGHVSRMFGRPLHLQIIPYCILHGPCLRYSVDEISAHAAVCATNRSSPMATT